MIEIRDEDFENILFFIINARSELARTLRDLRVRSSTFYNISLAKEYIARAEISLAQYDLEVKNEKK